MSNINAELLTVVVQPHSLHIACTVETRRSLAFLPVIYLSQGQVAGPMLELADNSTAHALHIFSFHELS